MKFLWIPTRGVSPRRSTGLLASIKSEGLLHGRDPPEGDDYIMPPFEHCRLLGDDLHRLRVLDAYLLVVEDGEIPGDEHFAGARQAI